MKVKHAIIFFAVGYGLDIAGAFLKITHQANADLVLGIAAIIKIAAVLFFLVKIIQYPKWKEFLNS